MGTRGRIERVKPSERILHRQYLAVELSAVGVQERRRGRGGEGRIRVSAERGSWRKDIMVGAKPEWSEVE